MFSNNNGLLHNPDSSMVLFDQYGFFGNGVLDRNNYAIGGLILTCRYKVKFLLSNGDNIELQPIEDTILDDCALYEQLCYL